MAATEAGHERGPERNMSKYSQTNLLPMFMKAAKLRNEMLAEGFTDNGGAIHSAERILDILGQRVCYAPLPHINSLKAHPDAERTRSADQARSAGNLRDLRIEHVAPLRALTRMAIAEADKTGEDGVLAVVKDQYRLVLLTAQEMAQLNGSNRSTISATRLEDCGIAVVAGKRPPWST